MRDPVVFVAEVKMPYIVGAYLIYLLKSVAPPEMSNLRIIGDTL